MADVFHLHPQRWVVTMILTATVPAPALRVARKSREDARRLGDLRAEAVRETERLFDGVSGKRINAALVPGLTRHAISRALNGCDGNPLYRLPSWFVLCRRIGIPKSRLQRVIDWLQQKLDEAYGDVPTPPLRDVLDHEEEQDARDAGGVQQRAYTGDIEAVRELLEIKRDEVAVLRAEVIPALERYAAQS